MDVWKLALAVCLVLAGSTPARADATDDRRALVMLRVLAYDKQLAKRIGDEVRVVVAYPADDDGAAANARWSAAFAKASKLKVDGRAVVVIPYRFDNAENLARTLAAQRAAALLACDGLTRKISAPQLAALTRAKKVLSISTREADVASGLAVGVVAGGTRDEIVVNVRAVEAEGVKFDAGLLQLARKLGDAR